MSYTRVLYQYRDAANWKTHQEVWFVGELDTEQKEAIFETVNDEGHFLPEQVGLDTLYGSLGDGTPTDDDHIWHELLQIDTVDWAPDGTTIPAVEFAERFAGINWDEARAQKFFDEWFEG